MHCTLEMRSVIGDDGAAAACVCVHCRSAVPRLYIEYSKRNIRLLECNSCHRIADPFVEMGILDLFVALVLHRPMAYIHAIHNRGSLKGALGRVVRLACTPTTILLSLSSRFQNSWNHSFIIYIWKRSHGRARVHFTGKELVHAVLRLPVSYWLFGHLTSLLYEPTIEIKLNNQNIYNIFHFFTFAAPGVTCWRVHCVELCCERTTWLVRSFVYNVIWSALCGFGVSFKNL